MIDLLILYILNGVPTTMYGISKKISTGFSPYTKPSFGTIKPALKRLENEEFIISRKEMSSGGKLTAYYALSEKGLRHLKNLILKDVSDNPVNFFANARVKIICSSMLATDEQFELYTKLKKKAELIKAKTEKMLDEKNSSLTFFQRIAFDNTNLEYKNFITMLEGLLNGCKG